MRLPNTWRPLYYPSQIPEEIVAAMAADPGYSLHHFPALDEDETDHTFRIYRYTLEGGQEGARLDHWEGTEWGILGSFTSTREYGSVVQALELMGRQLEYLERGALAPVPF
jgi:hypothetical protein